MKLLFAIYVGMVISVTLFPLTILMNGYTPDIRHSMNMLPLVTIIWRAKYILTGYNGDVTFAIWLLIKNVGGNVLLLMPLGFLTPIIFNKCNSLKKVLLIGLLTSLSIELLQLLELIFRITLVRAVDIDDVICNVVGVGIGFLIYRVFIWLARKLKIHYAFKLNQNDAKV
nr:VanZ family protein [Bacillus sp. FJAT-49736]